MSYQDRHLPEGELEMQPYSQFAGQQQIPTALPAQDFLARIQSTRLRIREFNRDVELITNLHKRALDSTNTSSSSGTPQQQLDGLVAAAQQHTTAIRDSLHYLKVDTEKSTEGGGFGLKKRQLEAVTAEFKQGVQGYYAEEQKYKSLCRQQLARQYRIVNPDATNEEALSAADRDWADEGIFQTALRTHRADQASTVLGNVRARHSELQYIERSIAELASLFQDLETLVISDEPAVEHIDARAGEADENISKGIEQVGIAQRSALNRRKLKWILFWVVLAILIIVGVAIGLYIKFR